MPLPAPPLFLGPPPTHSPVTGEPVPSSYLHASSSHFRDTKGRTVLLRGINLSSSAKTPRGQPAQQLDGFWEAGRSGEMSFVGRVLEEDDADEHLQRLKEWGFTCLRYVFTWESIEHAGPGKYDQEFIDYTIRMLKKCKEYGFYVYMDPHQDLWSRFSGGSGAPYWTLEACGLDPRNFTTTNAAVIECEWPSPATGRPAPAEFPAMIWASNYSRLACQTLFTLFFAGRDYAPKCVIDGVNIQDWLQDKYFGAVRALGQAIVDEGGLVEECVIGWDSINEPNPGLLGVEDLAKHGKESVLRVGPTPTAFEAMRLGMGERVEVENYEVGSLGSRKKGNIVVDPKGVRAWLGVDSEREGSRWGWTRGPEWELGTCIWGLHGVWDVEKSELLRPDYFGLFRGDGEGADIDDGGLGREVDFGQDYWLEHWKKYAALVRSFHKEAIHFIHGPVFKEPPKIKREESGGRAAHSVHYYDGLTLVTKHWNWFNADALGILRGKYASVILGVKVGEAAIRKSIREQLSMLRQDTFDGLGQYPTMMGEIGIPFDLDKKKAYRDGDYSSHVRALDASMNACDGPNLLNYTIWTYCPDNSHEWGDLWNGEDLGVWSKDDQRKMLEHRSELDLRGVDLVGKIPRRRSRASSSASSSIYGSSSRTTTPNASSAKLGNGNGNKASTSTLAVPTYTDSPTSTKLELSSPYSSLPLNFNDGARAISAFVRPYPMRTVGVPLDLNFDIKSSLFSLTIRVDAGDVQDPDVATEIYVPLVHYAAYPSRVCREADASSPSTPLPRVGEDDGEGGDYLSPFAPKLSLPDETLEEDPRALALKVSTSSGRWETEGQVLRWYYPRPAKGSMVVKIEIERMNGPIPTWVQQVGARPNVKNGIHGGQGADEGWGARSTFVQYLKMLFDFARTASLFLFAAATVQAHSPTRFTKRTVSRRAPGHTRRDATVTQIQTYVYAILSPFESEVTSIQNEVSVTLSNSTLSNDEIVSEVTSEVAYLVSLIQSIQAQLSTLPSSASNVTTGDTGSGDGSSSGDVSNDQIAQLLTNVFSSVGTTLADVQNQLGSVPALYPVVATLGNLLDGPLPTIVSGLNELLGNITTAVQNLLSDLGLGDLVDNLGGGLNNLLGGLGLKNKKRSVNRW